MKRPENKKFLKIIIILTSLVFLIIIGFGLWLYNGPLSQAKIKIFSSFPLPMAIVGGQNVPMNQFLLRYSLAQKLLGAETSGPDSTKIKNDIYNQLISQAETAAVAEKYGVSVSQNQIDADYQAEAQAQQNFSATLQNYGANQELFKNQIIKPSLISDNLELWFNSQQQLSPQIYLKATSLLAKIQSGADMGSLAAGFSQDQTGQELSGDLGFVDISSLLPELREPVANMKTGEIKIIPSRYGLHIIRLEGINGNQEHLRQIFLANPGFQTWYALQTQNIKIIKLINT